MEILTHGDPARIARVRNERLGLKEFECRKCGCLFLCMKGEYMYHSNQIDGSWYEATCPDCNSNLQVNV